MWRNGNAFRNWIDSSVDSGKNQVFNGPFGRPTVDNIYSIILGAVSWLWYQVILAKEKLRGYQIIQLIWVWVASKPFGEVLNFGSSDFNQFRYVSDFWLAHENRTLIGLFSGYGLEPFQEKSSSRPFEMTRGDFWKTHPDYLSKMDEFSSNQDRSWPGI